MAVTERAGVGRDLKAERAYISVMRTVNPILLVAMVICVHPLQAQNIPVTPSTPTEFKKRDLGGSLGTGSVGIKRAKTKPVVISYIAVTESRAFVNQEGKSITAQLVAFEEGDPAKLKQQLTLIKEGKIRLLVKGRGKASVLPLAKLSEDDQAFVKAVDEANKAAAAKKKPATP